MIHHKNGDIFNFTEDAVAHGCNCLSTMASGLAKTVKSKWPELYRADKNDDRPPQEKLGSFSYTMFSDGRYGYNIYSQFSFIGRRQGRRDLDYGALLNGLLSVCEDLSLRGKKSLALPRIGAGLAGGDWLLIENLLEAVSIYTKINIVIYTL